MTNDRCSATNRDGRRCDLFLAHGSYHAAKVGTRWIEWFGNARKQVAS